MSSRELTGLLEERGIDRKLAGEVALQLTQRDALTAHARLEIGIDPGAVSNPWAAALASMVSFTIGGLLPFLFMVSAPGPVGISASGIAVILALAATGWISARLAGAPPLPSIGRNVGGALLAMAVTFSVGRVAGSQL